MDTGECDFLERAYREALKSYISYSSGLELSNNQMVDTNNQRIQMFKEGEVHNLGAKLRDCYFASFIGQGFNPSKSREIVDDGFLSVTIHAMSDV